jgi:hypothetical protein
MSVLSILILFERSPICFLFVSNIRSKYMYMLVLAYFIFLLYILIFIPERLIISYTCTNTQLLTTRVLLVDRTNATSIFKTAVIPSSFLLAIISPNSL